MAGTQVIVFKHIPQWALTLAQGNAHLGNSDDTGDAKTDSLGYMYNNNCLKLLIMDVRPQGN